MSFGIYQEKLGWAKAKMAPSVSDGDVTELVEGPVVPENIITQEATTPSPPPIRQKGFKDVTVISSQTMFGENEEIIPTAQYATQPKKRNEEAQKRKHSRWALLLRRVVQRRQDRDYYLRTELCVQSKSLCNSLRELIPFTYDSIDISTHPMVLPAPFYELFFKKDEIEQFCQDDTKAKPLRDEMKLVRDYIRNDRLTLSQLDKHFSLLSQGKVSFEAAWTIFPPNELFLYVDGDEPECWLCRDIAKSAQLPLTWVVHGVRVDFDGNRLGMTKKSCVVSFAQRVDGAMNISQLPLIPVKYLPKGEWASKRSALIARGEKFRELLGPELDSHAYQYYEGPIVGKNIRLDSKVCHPKGLFDLDFPDSFPFFC